MASANVTKPVNKIS